LFDQYSQLSFRLAWVEAGIMARTALLLVDRKRDGASQAADEIISLASRYGLRIVERPALVDGPIDAVTGCSLIIVLGGDGTLLSMARRCVHLQLPLLGVNLGRLGFMAEFDLHRVHERAADLFGENANPSTRSLLMLRAEIYSNGKPRFSGLAVNEAAITAGPPFRMIELDLSVDGNLGPTLAGDGLLVSTPTGSTAYNVSAGGPIVAPGVDAITVTAIAAHTLSFRSLILPATSRFEATVRRGNDDADQTGTTLVLDGQVLEPVHTGERVVVSRAAETVHFVTDHSAKFWETVIEKLHWAARPKLRKTGDQASQSG